MINKDLYGIDPDAIYPWSPAAAYHDTDEGTKELIDGAPVVLVAPLTEKMALRVQSARHRWRDLQLQRGGE